MRDQVSAFPSLSTLRPEEREVAMSVGAWVLIVAVVLAGTFGTWRLLSDGRFRGTRRVRGAEEPVPGAESQSLLAGTPWQDDLGPSVTLLQFSSAFCAPCRVTRRILADAASGATGVAHIEVDAEQHLDLVRRLGIMRTPTTLVLDAHGQEVVRAQGAPKPEQVRAAIGAATSGSPA